MTMVAIEITCKSTSLNAVGTITEIKPKLLFLIIRFTDVFRTLDGADKTRN